MYTIDRIQSSELMRGTGNNNSDRSGPVRFLVEGYFFDPLKQLIFCINQHACSISSHNKSGAGATTYSSLERHTWHATATERQRPSLTNGAANRSPSLIGQAPSSLLLSSSPGLKVSFTLVLYCIASPQGQKKEKETINS